MHICRHSNRERINVRAWRWLAGLFAVAVLGAGERHTLGQSVKLVEFGKPMPNVADEPLAKQFSFARTAAFLDATSKWWTEQKKCGTCHTNFPYLMARPLLKEVPLSGHDEVRAFFEDRVAHWGDDAGQAKPRTTPRWSPRRAFSRSMTPRPPASCTR